MEADRAGYIVMEVEEGGLEDKSLLVLLVFPASPLVIVGGVLVVLLG